MSEEQRRIDSDIQHHVTDSDISFSVAKLDLEVSRAHSESEALEILKHCHELERMSEMGHLVPIDHLHRKPELLCQVFVFYDAANPWTRTSPCPAILLRVVCRTWRTQTLLTPQLWCSMRIHANEGVSYDCLQSELKSAEEWLSKSGTLLPLSIRIAFSDTEDTEWFNGITDMVRYQSARWWNIDIDTANPRHVHTLLNNLEHTPLDLNTFCLKCSKIGSTPFNVKDIFLLREVQIFDGCGNNLPLSWEHLTIINTGLNTLRVEEILDVIKHAPNFMECISKAFVNLDHEDSTMPMPTEVIKSESITHFCSDGIAIL